MNAYQTVLQEDRRLSLLLVLHQSPGYSANVFLLRDAIRNIYGHTASVDQVQTDVAWLAEQGLVDARTVGDVMIATMSGRGAEVAIGCAVVPGVKRPLP